MAPSELLNVGSKLKKKTVFGGFMTLSAITLILLAAYSIGDELFLKSQPNLIIQNIKSKNSPKIALTEESFSFGFAFQNYSGHYLYDYKKYFTVTAQRESYKLIDGQWSVEYYKPLSFVNCSRRKITGGDKYKKLFNNLECLNETEIDLEGNWNGDISKLISFNIFKCDNKTMNNTCKTPEEIEKIINNIIYINLYHTDRNFDSKDYSNPIQVSIKSTIFILSDGIFKHITSNYQETIIRTDQGFFLSDYKNDKTFKYEGYEIDNGKMRRDNMLFFMEIFSSSNHVIINRNYLKVQNFLAQLGGIANFFLYSVRFILFLYKKKERNIELINTYIELEDPNASKNMSVKPKYKISIKSSEKKIKEQRVSQNIEIKNEINIREFNPENENVIDLQKKNDVIVYIINLSSESAYDSITSEKQHFNLAWKYFHEMQSKEISEIDEKLFDLVEPKLQQVFNAKSEKSIKKDTVESP